MCIERKIVIYFQCNHNYLIVVWGVPVMPRDFSDQEMKLHITALVHGSKMTFIGHLLFNIATLHKLALRNTT